MAGKLSKMFYSLSARKPNGETHYGMSKLCAAIYYRKFDKAAISICATRITATRRRYRWR